METLEITFLSQSGRGYSTKRAISPLEATDSRTPLMRIKIGFQSIQLPRELLGQMLNQLAMAELAGSEYPDDWKPLAEAGFRPRVVTDEETTK